METHKDTASIIQPYFAFEDTMPTEYKNYKYCVDRKSRFWQQSKELFFLRKDVKKNIEEFRKDKKIDTKKINENLKQFRKLSLSANIAFSRVAKYSASKNEVNKFDEATKNKEYTEMKKERDKYWFNLKSDINKKFTTNDVRNMLKRYGKPFSWEDSLCYYILTGRIMSHNVHYKTYIKNNKIMIELFPQANVSDFRKLYMRIKALYRLLDKRETDNKLEEATRVYIQEDRVIVEIWPHWQPDAKGFNKLYKQIEEKQKYLRDKIERIKPKLDEYVDIAEQYEEDKNIEREIEEVENDPDGVSNKRMRALERIAEYKPEALDDEKEQRKEEARHRKIHSICKKRRHI